MLIDTLDVARTKGIPILQAELRSEQGAESMREHRIDVFFAATQNDIYNSLVCSKQTQELGRGKVFQLAAAELAGSRHATASAFFLEKLEVGEDFGDDEMALLIVRSNGDLVFVSAEMPKVDLVEGDRILRVPRRKTSSVAA